MLVGILTASAQELGQVVLASLVGDNSEVTQEGRLVLNRVARNTVEYDRFVKIRSSHRVSPETPDFG